MLDPANLMFIVAFIVLPVVIGVWALMTRRHILRRPPSTRRRMITPAPPDEQATLPAAPPPEVQHRPQPIVEEPSPEEPAQDTEEFVWPEHAFQAPPPTPEPTRQQTVHVPAQETVQMPAAGSGSTEPTTTRPRSTRRFFAPRYAGRSTGTVKRFQADGPARFLSPR